MNIVLTELYPLNRAKPARARKSDPSTSHDAAKRTEAAAATHLLRSAIKAAVAHLGGATSKEVASMLLEDWYKVNKRMSECEGLYMTDEQRGGCKVWRSV